MVTDSLIINYIIFVAVILGALLLLYRIFSFFIPKKSKSEDS